MAKKKEKVGKLEKEIADPNFWQKKEKAVEISQEAATLKEEIGNFDYLRGKLKDLEELGQLASQEGEELKGDLKTLEASIEKEELKVFLSGEYDRNSVILSISAGAGGQDSQDWATMLLRMYERFFLKKSFKSKILHQSFGEGGGPEGRIGTKSVTLEVQGSYAYGLLKKETGVHRLVRISPFSPQKLRHTSFALVEVLPEIEREKDIKIKIKPEELKIDFYRASGPGGQNVNKRESAVRLTHLSTGIVVYCQSERLQGQNREKAMKMLYSKIHKLEEDKRQKELSKIKGKTVSASWGNQIRSYVFHPYKLVKDLRTGVETSDVENVMDGNLDKFIEAEIKQ